MEFLSSLNMLPLIADLRQQAETIRPAELEKTLRHLPDLTEAERIRIDALTQALVKKLLDSPTRRLHAEATSPHAPEYAALTRTLFGLENRSNPHDLQAILLNNPCRRLINMKLIFATRPSALARWQTQWVINALKIFIAIWFVRKKSSPHKAIKSSIDLCLKLAARDSLRRSSNLNY